MEQGLVSVIMSAYNEKEEWIRASVESILKQTYQNIEFVIVLDNPDNEPLREIISEYARKDQRIRFLQNQKNMGLVASLNKALKHATGEMIARMDADDISYEDRIQKQYDILEKEGVDFVMSSADFIQADGHIVTGAADEKFGPSQVREVTKYGNISMHPTWFAKKSVFEQLKGYRDVKYCEDYEFVLRALQKGVKICKSGEHVLQYRLRDSGVSKMNTLEQTMKARYLRVQYARGNRIEELSVKKLNRRFSAFSDEEKEKFNRADRMIEMFSQRMAEGKWIGCLSCFLKGSFSNRYFRILFGEFFKCYRVRKKLAQR